MTFEEGLRSEVMRVASEVRMLIEMHRLPPPVADRRCTHCSLLEICLPYVDRLTEEVYCK